MSEKQNKLNPYDREDKGPQKTKYEEFSKV